MKGLQILAYVLLLAAFCKADEDSEEKKMKEMAKECADEFGLSKETVEKIPRMICDGEKLDEKTSCHTSCFYKKIGVIENGEILTDEVKSTILSQMKDDDVKKQLEEKLDKCKNEIAAVTDECDKAVEFTRCLLTGTEFCQKVQ